MAKYPEPEYLILTSAGKRLAEKDSAKKAADPGASGKRDEAILLPYSVAYRILPADIATTVLPLQKNRFEATSFQGTLTLVVGSFSKTDEIVTWVDPSKNLWHLFHNNPEISIPKYRCIVPPRITVEVFDASSGRVWQRSGIFHMPEGIDRPGKPGEHPYVFRAEGRDIIGFAPPPRVEIVLPKDPPTTEATIKAKFSGVGEKDALRFVLACAYPIGRRCRLTRTAAGNATGLAERGPVRPAALTTRAPWLACSASPCRGGSRPPACRGFPSPSGSGTGPSSVHRQPFGGRLVAPPLCRKTSKVSRRRAWRSSSPASPASVLSTQARSRSADPSIMATGATSLNATARGEEPAASATAWAAMACRWVRRNPAVPLAASPNAKWMSPSTPTTLAAAASNVSRIPSGSQAHALDTSRGRKTGSEQSAFPATWLIACSSRVMLSTPAAASPAQHTTPTWYWRSR